jgi:TolB-like protein
MNLRTSSMIGKNLLRALLLLAALSVAGCATSPEETRYFKDDKVQLELLQKVAVLPFVNNTQTKLVENRFSNIVTTEILSRGLFEVATTGDVLAFLREEVRGDPTAVDAGVARKMGRALKVDAYLTGAVEIYDMERNGSYSYPVIAVTMQLIDIKSGRIIWQAAGGDTGYGAWSRVFGLASDDFNQVSFRLARKLLDTMQTSAAE